MSNRKSLSSGDGPFIDGDNRAIAPSDDSCLAGMKLTIFHASTELPGDRFEVDFIGPLTEKDFSSIADRFPEVWRRLAQEVARRLEQRNSLIRPQNEKIRVFVISSAEALPVARSIENSFKFDPFATIVWANGVFRVTNYTLESLEEQLDQCDFAVAVAHPDDQTLSRDVNWPSPRDNVIFELGFFMGRLGRSRAILMEPRETQVKLPSDLAGVTTISYRFDPREPGSSMGVACNELRDHIMRLGRNV